MSPSRTRYRTALFAGSAIFVLTAPSAYAQDRPPSAPVEEANSGATVITVVGSQIKGSSVAGTLPVTIIDADFIATVGAISGDDVFRALPSNGSLLTNHVNFNAGINAVRGDVASINLRSLGTGNTLTLPAGP